MRGQRDPGVVFLYQILLGVPSRIELSLSVKKKTGAK